MSNVGLKLSQSNRIYRPSERLDGKIIIKSSSSISHNRVFLNVNGSVNLQIRGGSAGVIESFYGVLKPITIVKNMIEVRASGKTGSGTTEPFIESLRFGVPPNPDSLKFDVNGSTKDGQAGIGGVLRDQNGKLIYIFSANVGNRDALTTEFLAIPRATELCAANSEMWGKDITFVSDSNVDVSWINRERTGGSEHVNLIFGICSNLNTIGQARMTFNYRFSNSVVNILAKRGSGGGDELLSWSC